MLIRDDITQRSAEWFKLHRNRLTGSRFATVMNGGARAWRTLMMDMRSPREVAQHGRSGIPALDWGAQYEKHALAMYELQEHVTVRRVGFIVGDDERYGCSPDGLVSRKGMVEVKCPFNPEVHAKTLRRKLVPEEYRPQIQGGMWVSKRDWCDFVTYDPRNDEQPILVLRVPRDERYIGLLAQRCETFLSFYKAKVDPTTATTIPKLF